MNLSTNVSSIKIKNPLMPASGPLVGDDKKMLILESFGLGAMVTKTISIKGAIVPRPCIYGYKDKIMNAELWSEYDYKKWIDEFLPKLKSELKIPLIVSVGYTKEDMEFLIPKLDEFADGFEISTHYVGTDLNVIGETVRTIRKNTNKPIFMKISPHMPDILAFVKVVKENGGNGIVAINSLGPTMIIDLAKRKVRAGNDQGLLWTSGPSIKSMALAIVNLIKEAYPDFTVIGVGGVASAEDVIEFILAGADGVQMLSSAMLKGKDLYKKIIDDLPETLKKYGFNSIEEVRNTKLEKKAKYIVNYPKLNKEKCTRCRVCEKGCPYFAITMDKYPIFNEDLCFSCGLCESRCAVGAIEGVL